AIARLAVAYGVPAESLTVSRLARLAPGYAARLTHVADRLREVLETLRVKNGRNRFLAERTLGWLRGLFEALAAALAPQPTYSRSGHADPALEGLHLLDRQA